MINNSFETPILNSERITNPVSPKAAYGSPLKLAT